jgi:ubiquinone/menaquinone biosynthesis C-methylase UbiE
VRLKRPRRRPLGRSFSPPVAGAGRPLGRAKNWDKHVENAERLAATPAFLALRDEILALARLRPSHRVLDVGAGTGLLALAAAPHVAHVSALDISPAMCRRLEAKLATAGVANVEVLTGSATGLPLTDGAVDVVVSNYCLHHLTDSEKLAALAEVRRVLSPGGRLVFGDMMFAVSLGDRRDRAVIARVVKRMLARGPAGLARLFRNALRVLIGRGEHPAPVAWWREALGAAGFEQVSVRELAHEGGIASALRPELSAPGTLEADGFRLRGRLASLVPAIVSRL